MINQDFIHTFEQEFNRLLTPMEKEIINDWKKKDGLTEETIIKGLKQAVFSGVVNLKYIDKILKSWKKENEEPTTGGMDLSFLD